MKLSKSDERLRQESPAYQPDADWEVLEPQAMNVVMSVRIDGRAARGLYALAREAGKTPSRLVRDWTLERLDAETPDPRSAVTGIREAAGTYETGPDAYEELRQRHRPQKVDILLVGESRPAGGTFFYLANSNLYYATHEAFQRALGPMPARDAFLSLLRERGVWLYDIANAPVDRMRGRPRRVAVQARVSHLVDLLSRDPPRLVVAIKKDLEPTVRQAMREAGLGVDRLRVLPFPLYQWRQAFVHGLAALVSDGSGESRLLDRQTKQGDDSGSNRPTSSISHRLPRADELLRDLVGNEIRTLTGVPNRILRIVGDKVIVATSRSPQGKPVPMSEVQDAIDALAETGDLLIDVPTVGHRSAFIGAVLHTLPGVEATTRPRRIRLVTGGHIAADSAR